MGPEITWEVSGPTGFRPTQEFKVQVLVFISFYFFTYFWPCWALSAVQGLPAVLVPPVAGTGSRRVSFSCCKTLAWLFHCTCLVAPQQVESSPARYRTHAPCIGRRILTHCATREVQYGHFSNINSCNPRAWTTFPFLSIIFSFLY